MATHTRPSSASALGSPIQQHHTRRRTTDRGQPFRLPAAHAPPHDHGNGYLSGRATTTRRTRTSALRFTTSDRVSPLRAGRGYWRYLPTATGTTFITGFNYEPGWGRLVDRVVMRRLIGWMTAWSFDRLRIWAETGTPPERWPLASVLAFWRPTRPKASRCRRTPRIGNAMTQAPVTLHTLEAP